MPIKKRKGKKILAKANISKTNVLPKVDKVSPNRPLHCPAGKMGSHPGQGGPIQQ